MIRFTNRITCHINLYAALYVTIDQQETLIYEHTDKLMELELFP